MSYESKVKVYYCKKLSDTPSEANRIVPGPMISINPEIYYANDSVVGYTYNITLNGYANSLRREKDDRPSGEPNYGADQTIGHIDDIRDIFNSNGGKLVIIQDEAEVLTARGATIKSLQFNESNNYWVNYAPFSVEIEFNEVEFNGCPGSQNPSIVCSSTFFHTPNQDEDKFTSDNLVDMKAFKIKEFSDKWSFTIDDQIYDNYEGFYNSHFRVSYSLSATGKNYYVNDQFVPAWQQARLFVQDRLYKQVNALINGILLITSNNKDGCSPTLELKDLHDISTIGGALEDFDTPKNNGTNYQVYNEVITCDTSEASGTFSINYDAILKKYNPAFTPQENSALHNYTQNITYDENNQTTIAVQGTIQGLVQGGFIYRPGNEFTLPQNGNFIVRNNGAETKYSNALEYFNTRIGTSFDLNDDFKSKLKITKRALLINEDGFAGVSSFTLDHNYHDGAITYSANYDTQTAQSFGLGYSNITIVRNDPTEITQEFIIPGRRQGPLIQKLGMYTPRTVSITIEGANRANRDCNVDVCNSRPYADIPNFDQLTQISTDYWIKTKEDYTVNKIDGSYSINLEYMCRSPN